MARERTSDRHDKSNDSTGKQLLNRRSYLQLSAAAVGTVAAGSSAAAAAGSKKKTVNIVDAGADQNGSQPVTSLLEKVAGDNTRVVFPKGTYKINSTSFTNLDGFELVAPKGATLVPASKGKTTMLFRLCKNLRFEGFTVDTSASNTAVEVGVQVVGGKNVIKDYHLKGRQDISPMSKGFWVKCERKDTDLTFDNIYLGDGAEDGGQGIGMFLFPSKNFANKGADGGSITLKDMHVEGWNHEGVYGSPHRGKLTVIGGLYKNNCEEQLRVGGGNYGQQAHVKDVTIVVDDPPSYLGAGIPAPNPRRNFRGLWCEEGDGLLVEDCDIHIGKVPLAAAHSSGAICIHKQYGRATIKNTNISVDMDKTPAIKVQRPQSSFNAYIQPSMDHLPPKWTVNIENVSMTGSANGGAAVLAEGRKDVSLKNCCIQQTGTNRAGVEYKSAGGKVIDSTINTDGKAIISGGSNVQTQNVSKDGTCKVPNLKPKNGQKIPADSGSSSTNGSSGSASAQRKSSTSNGSKNVISIQSHSKKVANYQLTVNGSLTSSDANGGTFDTQDKISGRNAEGAVAGGTDSYAFSGSITDFTLSGPATVLLNGKKVDPATLGSGSHLPHVLVIDGESPKKDTKYEFSVTGDIKRVAATTESEDTVRGKTAKGVVEGASDTYRFSGDLTSFMVSGNATLNFN